MDEATELFFRDGVRRYADAYATVRAYEEAAKAKMREVAVQHAATLGGLEQDAFVSVAGGYAGGRIAYAVIRAMLGEEKVTWQIGIWWESPQKGTDVTVYAECVEGPERLRNGNWPSAPEGRWVAYSNGLKLFLTPDDDVGGAFERLLPEVARQATATAAKSG